MDHGEEGKIMAKLEAPGDSAEALDPAAVDRLSLLIFWPKLTGAPAVAT